MTYETYEEAEMGPKEPSRWSVGPRQGCSQGFSDGLSRTFMNKDKKRRTGALCPAPNRELANLTHTFVPATLEPRGARSPPG